MISVSHSRVRGSGWFLDANRGSMQPELVLSCNACSLEGQSTGNCEVQDKNKAMKYSPPGAQLLLTHPPKWVLCLYKSEGTETLTLLREGNYSCTVWGENTQAGSASSWDCTGVNSEEIMPLRTQGDPLQPVWQQLFPPACLGLQDMHGSFSSMQSRSHRRRQHRDLHMNKVTQTSSLTFIRVHDAHFHLPIPGRTSAQLLKELVSTLKKKVQIQMSGYFAGLSPSKQRS